MNICDFFQNERRRRTFVFISEGRKHQFFLSLLLSRSLSFSLVLSRSLSFSLGHKNTIHIVWPRRLASARIFPGQRRKKEGSGSTVKKTIRCRRGRRRRRRRRWSRSWCQRSRHGWSLSNGEEEERDDRFVCQKT